MINLSGDSIIDRYITWTYRNEWRRKRWLINSLISFHRIGRESKRSEHSENEVEEGTGRGNKGRNGEKSRREREKRGGSKGERYYKSDGANDWPRINRMNYTNKIDQRIHEIMMKNGCWNGMSERGRENELLLESSLPPPPHRHPLHWMHLEKSMRYGLDLYTRSQIITCI